ncbi:MAG TPA: preprotein translocase subunit YajC [Gaiellaceae bacterium]|nr:preprotein translocase subunit YajC [Gaiellaceae bacterium]
MGGYVIILIAVFALMWLLLIRPQRKRQLAQARMQDAVEVGDDVLTAGGIHGTVREIDGEIVHVEIAPNTTVRLDRRAVAAVAQEPEPEPETLTEPGQPAPGDES